MLGSADLIAFVPTRDPTKAREFYEQTLGLEFLSADPFALVFNAHGTTLRIANVSGVKDFQPAPFTIIGWQVTNVSDTAGDLVKKGRQQGRPAVIEACPQSRLPVTGPMPLRTRRIATPPRRMFSLIDSARNDGCASGQASRRTFRLD